MHTLIADAGGTSTQWCLLNQNNAHSFETEGINPSFTSDNKIASIVQEAATRIADLPMPEKIVFYGAGCRATIQKQRIYNILAKNFPGVAITVFTDLEGAARALYGNDKGLVLILGTGANSGFYNGKILTHNINHLGFLLGDEGSGGYLGKQWLKAWCTNQAPQELAEACTKMCKKSSDDNLTELYKEAHPNRFAASFVPFIAHYRNHPFIQQMLKRAFSLLCETYLVQYSHVERESIRITGGVAVQFQEELREAFKLHGLFIDFISQSPMQELIAYHQTQ